jgi:Set1/Ash2 histone methyltransferase complex subunit ASH2
MGPIFFNSTKTTAGVAAGKWYYEVELLAPEGAPPNMPAAHVRLGYAQKFGNLQGPCGLDAYSYAWRDLEGTVFHKSRGAAAAAASGAAEPSGFGVGDVVGLGIVLPPLASAAFPPGFRQGEKAVLYKNTVYFEERIPGAEGGAAAAAELPVARGSALLGFVNGAPRGELARDLERGEYFAALSLYMYAGARVNFGPTFRHPPPPGFRPYSEAAAVVNAQHVVHEILDAVERRLAGPSGDAAAAAGAGGALLAAAAAAAAI